MADNGLRPVSVTYSHFALWNVIVPRFPIVPACTHDS